MNEIFTVKGETDGTSTTGDFPLFSDLFYQSVTSIRIPKGLKLKIWCKRINGSPVDVLIYYTKNIIIPSPDWRLVGFERLASSGEFALEKRRPVVLRATTGLEGVKLSWSQASAAKSYVEAEVELSDED